MDKRLEVLKTYKLFIGGAFPRTESGRYDIVTDKKGTVVANVCRSSRKDLRNAVQAARGAFFSWSQRPAFNKSQILYRMAEMLEGKKGEIQNELVRTGIATKEAEKEVIVAIDRLVYFAGWADKYQAVFSSVNPVSGSYFNFSVYEPTGVVVNLGASEKPLLSFVDQVIPAITGGNTAVFVVPSQQALPLIAFAEALATSDLPAGVINILSGSTDELLPHLSVHMDVNAITYTETKWKEPLEKSASTNVKRIIYQKTEDPLSPYSILDLQEVKTTWHPIENVAPGGKGY